MIKVFSVIFGLILCFQAQAQQNKVSKEVKDSPFKRADVLSAQTSLESMLAKRYSRELSAIVDSEAFKIGAVFDLEINEKSTESNEVIHNLGYSDLDLGYLDATELSEAYSDEEMLGFNPFERFKIKKVDVQVGLQPNLPEEVKSSVETWLAGRVQRDFGKNGSAKVQFIQNPKLQGALNKPIMEMIKDMQGLVGNLLLGLCILFGVLLWKVLSGKTADSQAGLGSGSPSVSINSSTEASISKNLEDMTAEDAAQLDKSYVSQIEKLSAQVKDLSPRVVDYIESLIHEWSEKGEEGLNQIACFAEISGSVLGSLPIPAEQKKKMGPVFAKMHMMTNVRRFEVLSRVYWDMVASLNLGTEALHRPFSFMNNSGLSKVNNVLLGNDIDTQTVVTMYMPETMRKAYFKELGSEQKVDLLNSAAKLSAISENELKGIESQIAPYFSEKDQQSESSVSMDLTFTKLVDAMSLQDACTILPTVTGPVVEQFKQTQPHIAFLQEWTKDTLSLLVKQASTEHLLTYLRLVPDMKYYVFEFVSPRVSQILKDDLEQPDNMQVADKEKHLESFNSLIVRLVSNGEINFYEAIENDKHKGLKVAA